MEGDPVVQVVIIVESVQLQMVKILIIKKKIFFKLINLNCINRCYQLME